MERRSPKRGSNDSRYDGFKGAWDDHLKAFVFENQEERDRFQITTYGKVRMGFREPDEPPDGRPMIVYRSSFRDGDEQAAYERAVREIDPIARYAAPMPARDDSEAEQQREARDGWLGMQALCDEIVNLATGLDPGAALKGPRRRMSQREWARRQVDVKMRAAGDDWRC